MNKIAIGMVFWAAACGGSDKSASTAAVSNPCAADPCADPCGGNPCAGGPMELGVDWSTWESWEKVNAEPFVSKGHKKPWVNVYVPPAAKEAYAALAGPMAEGFAVVKSGHSDVEGAAGPAQALTVMVKMGPEYDPDNGNWYYGVISTDGKKAMNEGKISACINCHAAADTDYLFGTR